jgi:hypothetical protein
MKREWSPEELNDFWTLSPTEKKLLANKSGATRIGFAILLKFFQHEACFPQGPETIPDIIVQHLGRQVGVSAMIEGVLRHCTEMSVDRQYVDSHGQSGCLCLLPASGLSAPATAKGHS